MAGLGVRWITVVGWSPMAAINGLWYAVKSGICPVEVVVINAGASSQNIEKFKKYADRIITGYSSCGKPKVWEEKAQEEPIEFYRLLKRLVDESRLDIVLDITPGRKFMSAFVLHLGMQNPDKVKKIIYVHLFHRFYENVPYPLIPRTRQKIYDLKEMK